MCEMCDDDRVTLVGESRMTALTMDERRRSTEKDVIVYQQLHAMISELQWIHDHNDLPYANDLSMRCYDAQRAIERCMEACNLPDGQ